jgi:hypothetical protein
MTVNTILVLDAAISSLRGTRRTVHRRARRLLLVNLQTRVFCPPSRFCCASVIGRPCVALLSAYRLLAPTLLDLLRALSFVRVDWFNDSACPLNKCVRPCVRRVRVI